MFAGSGKERSSDDGGESEGWIKGLYVESQMGRG